MTNEKLEDFSLLGGPLFRLACMVGLVRGDSNTTLLGLALGIGAWFVLVVLAMADGVIEQIFSPAVMGGHVRLLLVIPLFFVCEAWVAPRINDFLRTIVQSGVVPKQSVPLLERELSRISRWKDSWLPEAIFLLASILLMLGESYLPVQGVTAKAATNAALAGQWYWLLCLPLFRFLMLRWVWHIGLWCFLLWRISKLELNLIPTHPDGAGGLGYLEIVQSHFIPLVFAISALQAAMFAEEFIAGKAAFEQIYPGLALVLLVDALLFVAPMFIFSSSLWACRVKAWSNYMEFASRYVHEFDRKWIASAGKSVKEPLLGTPDLQSLADLGNSMSSVRNMRLAPVSMNLISRLLIVAVLPLLPLLLLKYPFAELLQKFFINMTGL